MKVRTWLTPRRLNAAVTIMLARNAGKPEKKDAFAKYPGSTILSGPFQRHLFSALASRERGSRFSGSESSRIDAHQEYRLGKGRARQSRLDAYASSAKSSRPIIGRMVSAARKKTDGP
jgi:hypothetical protein